MTDPGDQLIALIESLYDGVRPPDSDDVARVYDAVHDLRERSAEAALHGFREGASQVAHDRDEKARAASQEQPHHCEWQRKYEGMVKERDDQIHRKRETRRILTERASQERPQPDLRAALKAYDKQQITGPELAETIRASQERPPIDVQRLAEAMSNVMSYMDWHDEYPERVAAEYARLSGSVGEYKRFRHDEHCADEHWQG